MFGALLDNTLDQIGVAEALIDAHEELVKQQPPERQSLYKLYAVTSCVTRLYAIYERFVETLISDFLDAVPELVPYSKLSDGLKAEYRRGISHILSKIDGERYGHLRHENVVQWYHEALTSESKYRFVVEALTRHEQNLRLQELERLASRVDAKDLRSWLSHSAEVVDLYEERSAVVEQLEAELRDFVQTRNDAAHGVLEDLKGKDLLVRYCALIRSLVRAIAAHFHKSLLDQRTNAGRARHIATVIEVFPRSGAFVARLEEGHAVRLGMLVHLVGTGYCSLQKIESLQIDGVVVEQAVAERPNFEVGIKCAVNPQRNARIFLDV